MNSVAKSVRHTLKERFGNRVLFDEVLAPYLAYGVGGPADFLVFPQSIAELTWLADLANTHQLRTTILGAGTNVLVKDQGLDGIVLVLRGAFDTIEQVGSSGDKILVRCGGAVPKAALLDWAVKRGLAGLVFSAGVPGTIGGGIYMNAGTKYGCYADILQQLTVFDFKLGVHTLERSDLYFGYREQTAVDGSLVLDAVFALEPSRPEVLKAEVVRIIAERAAKQPLDHPSCGSTFKNPEGHSAGRLIEKAGLKGISCGGAEISDKHANFILNKNNATAADILTLIEMVHKRVYETFEIKLETEVIILGRNTNIHS